MDQLSRDQLNETFILLSDGVDKIHYVLTWLLQLGVFVSLEHFAVFIASIVIPFLLTCSEYTIQARPWLIVTIIIESVFIERCVMSWYLSSDQNSTSNMEGLHFILWIFRYATAFVCLLILMYFYTSYCNYEAINHQLLKKIIEQNHQIKRHLKLEIEEVEDDPPKASWFSPVKASTPSTAVGFTNESAIIPTQHIPGYTNESAIVPTQNLPGFTNESAMFPTQAPHVGIYQSPVHSEIGKPDQDSVNGNQPDSGIDDLDSHTECTKCRYNLRKRCKQHYSSKTLEITRRSLLHSRNKSKLLRTHCSASGHSSYFNTHDITT